MNSDQLLCVRINSLCCLGHCRTVVIISATGAVVLIYYINIFGTLPKPTNLSSESIG